MGNFAENLNLGNRFRPPPVFSTQMTGAAGGMELHWSQVQRMSRLIVSTSSWHFLGVWDSKGCWLISQSSSTLYFAVLYYTNFCVFYVNCSGMK